MELQLSSILITFFLLAMYFLFMKSSETQTKTNLPPGPWKLPVLGSLHHLVGSQPHIALTNLARKYGPIMHLRLGEVSTIVVSSPRLAKEVLKTHDLAFANRMSIFAGQIMLYGSQDIAFSPYGPYWRQMRKIAKSELLSPTNVRMFSSICDSEAHKLVEIVRYCVGTRITLSEMLHPFNNVVTCKSAFGKRSEYQDAFISLLKESNPLTSGFTLADLYPSVKVLPVLSGMKFKLMRMHKKIDEMLESIVKEHEESSRRWKRGSHGIKEEDLVDVLLRYQKSGDLECPITTNNIKAIILDVFVGGTDTSSVTIEWAMSELIKNPRVMDKLQSELRQALKGNEKIDSADIQGLSYLNSVVKETLRLHPPVALIPRECREECEIDGYRIPIKTKVLVNAWSIGRDQAFWKDAEKFLLERFCDNSPNESFGTDFRFLAFGAGRRICPGISFGIANVELPLAQLCYHFNWSLPDGMKAEDLDMTESFGATTARKNNLLLTATPYTP